MKIMIRENSPQIKDDSPELFFFVRTKKTHTVCYKKIMLPEILQHGFF